MLWDAIYAYQIVVSGLQTFHCFHSIVFCVTFVYIGGVSAEFISGSPTVWLNKHPYILWLSQTNFFGLQTFITGGVSILQIHDLFLTLEFKVTIQLHFWFTSFVLFFSTKRSAIIMYLDLQRSIGHSFLITTMFSNFLWKDWGILPQFAFVLVAFLRLGLCKFQ